MTVQPEAEAHSSSLRPLDDVERTRSVESASSGSQPEGGKVTKARGSSRYAGNLQR
jgi:hypothetical protein